MALRIAESQSLFAYAWIKATFGNGTMVALFLETPDEVDAFHKKALELGDINEGDPDFRPAENGKGFHVGYFRDLDGNKLNAFLQG